MRTGDEAWGSWTTALWVAAALLLKDYLFPKLEHLVLNGTAIGHAIDAHLALGALNLALVWFVPILLLLAAVWMKRLPVRSYFAWVATRPRDCLARPCGGRRVPTRKLCRTLSGGRRHDVRCHRAISLGANRWRSRVAAAVFRLAKLHRSADGRRKHLPRLFMAWLGGLAARRQRHLVAQFARVRRIPHPKGDRHQPAPSRDHPV